MYLHVTHSTNTNKVEAGTRSLRKYNRGKLYGENIYGNCSIFIKLPFHPDLTQWMIGCKI